MTHLYQVVSLSCMLQGLSATCRRPGGSQSLAHLHAISRHVCAHLHEEFTKDSCGSVHVGDRRCVSGDDGSAECPLIPEMRLS
jgi:hypothetical protein